MGRNLGSSLEHVRAVDPRIRPGQSEAPDPKLVFGMYVLPTVPTVGAIFKQEAMREQSVDTIWTVYVTEPS